LILALIAILVVNTFGLSEIFEKLLFFTTVASAMDDACLLFLLLFLLLIKSKY